MLEAATADRCDAASRRVTIQTENGLDIPARENSPRIIGRLWKLRRRDNCRGQADTCAGAPSELMVLDRGRLRII
jgi:hypothetical protein